MDHCLLLKPIRISKLNPKGSIIKIEKVQHACVICGDKPPYPLRLKIYKSDGHNELYPLNYKYKWLY